MNKQIEALAMKLILAKDKCKARRTCDGCNYSNINDANLCEALLMAEELLKYYKPIDDEGLMILTREEYNCILDNILNLSTKIELYQGLLKDMSGVRKETVDKFTDWLKTECYNGGIDSKLVIVSFSRLDEIAKEIMEGK